MSALAGGSWSSQSSAMDTAMPRSNFSEVGAMRNGIRAVRDTMLVLVVQLVFRAMLLLRRWNY